MVAAVSGAGADAGGVTEREVSTAAVFVAGAVDCTVALGGIGRAAGEAGGAAGATRARAPAVSLRLVPPTAPSI